MQRFEINWNYDRKKAKKSEEEPYIRLSFQNPPKTMEFSYDEDMDRYIRSHYGEPDLDNWTTVGQ